LAHGVVAELRLPRLEIVLERMELAAACDGFLRGAPEPCLVVACYQLAAEHTETLGRAIYRFQLEQAAPCQLSPRDRLLDLPVLVESYPLRVCVLVCALEENGGTDIQAVYRELGNPEKFLLWRTRELEPEPRKLNDVGPGTALNRAEAVHLLCEGEQLAASLTDDTWVGAACAVVEFKAPGGERTLNFHTVSSDRSNDWLSGLSLRFTQVAG
jgi:hypothetical protein